MKKPYYQQQAEDRAIFLRDTRDHRLTIHQNEGVYRHMTMARPGSSVCHFNVTTFPGYLVFTGDMGCFTFSRTNDMFGFMDIGDRWNDARPSIDYHYWSEKCRAEDTNSSGREEFDSHAFTTAVRTLLREHMSDKDMPLSDRKTIVDDARFNVLQDFGDYTEATEAARHWRCPITGEHPLYDAWDYGPFLKPSYSFRWACWAIAYTIRCFRLGGDRHTRQGWHDALVLSGEW